MKTLFKKIRKVFAAGIEAWRQEKFNPPVIIQNQSTAHRVNAVPVQEPQNQNPRSFQERIIQNEFAAETCTQEQQSVRVFGQTSGGNIPTSHSHESFTDDGLISNKSEALMTSAEGRLIKPDELHGGGRCGHCGCLTAKIEFCEICKLPLCFGCYKVFENKIVCIKHYKELDFNKDTWVSK
jgi:hypothetical protein